MPNFKIQGSQGPPPPLPTPMSLRIYHSWLHLRVDGHRPLVPHTFLCKLPLFSQDVAKPDVGCFLSWRSFQK